MDRPAFFFLDDVTNELGLCSFIFPCGAFYPATPKSYLLAVSSPFILKTLLLKVITETAVGCKNNTRLLCHGCNFVWPATWLRDGKVSPPSTMPLSGSVSVRSLCCALSLLARLWFPLQDVYLFLFLLFFFLSVFLSVDLFLSDMSRSSLCFSCIEIQNPRSDRSSQNFQGACHSLAQKDKKECMHGQQHSRC